MKKITSLFLIIFPFCVTNVGAQEISKAFKKQTINDNFTVSSVSSELWQQVSTGNELYIVQNGEYVLHRKDKRNPDVIFPNNGKEFSGFDMMANIIFDKHSNKDQSAGLVFMAQNGGTGALMIEINNNREYRLRKLENNKLRNLYYGPNDGWIKSEFLLSDMYNKIEIKSYEKVYDLYFNNTYVRSFSDLEYKQGNVGIYLAPDTKARVDNFKVFEEDILQDIADTLHIDRSALEDQSLTDVIIELNAKIKSLQKEIEGLNRDLVIAKQAPTIDTATQGRIDRLEKKIAQQKAEIDRLNKSVEKMTDELIELRKYKENVEANGGNGNIIDNMSKAINKEKEKNKEKQEKINELREENANLKSENRDLKTQLEQLGGGEEEEE